jgi:hypothetical protein
VTWGSAPAAPASLSELLMLRLVGGRLVCYHFSQAARSGVNSSAFMLCWLRVHLFEPGIRLFRNRLLER